jgi:hypothetical protein
MIRLATLYAALAVRRVPGFAALTHPMRGLTAGWTQPVNKEVP